MSRRFTPEHDAWIADFVRQELAASTPLPLAIPRRAQYEAFLERFPDATHEGITFGQFGNRAYYLKRQLRRELKTEAVTCLWLKREHAPGTEKEEGEEELVAVKHEETSTDEPPERPMKQEPPDDTGETIKSEPPTRRLRTHSRVVVVAPPAPTLSDVERYIATFAGTCTSAVPQQPHEEEAEEECEEIPYEDLASSSEGDDSSTCDPDWSETDSLDDVVLLREEEPPSSPTTGDFRRVLAGMQSRSGALGNELRRRCEAQQAPPTPPASSSPRPRPRRPALPIQLHLDVRVTRNGEPAGRSSRRFVIHERPPSPSALTEPEA